MFFKGLTVYSKTQSILIDGKLSENPKDQLDILLKDFNLLTFKRVIPEKIINLEGIINGVASVKKKEGEYIFTSDLKFKKFRINDNLVGNGNLESAWNSANQSLKLNGEFFDGYQPTIKFGGYYYPNNTEDKLDLTLTLTRVKLNMFNAYTKDFLGNLKGNADANILLTGNFKEPKLNGSITLNNTEFVVRYLNTKYSTNLCKINKIGRAHV